MMTKEQQYLVRQADFNDALYIIDFQLKMAMETESLQLDGQTLSRGVGAVYGDPSRGFYLVVEHGGEVVASTMVTPEWSDWRCGWIWWIQSVYVLPDHRRKGVFSKIYQYIKEMAQHQGDVLGLRLYVEKHNTGAQKTYLALGMSDEHYTLFEDLFV